MIKINESINPFDLIKKISIDLNIPKKSLSFTQSGKSYDFYFYKDGMMDPVKIAKYNARTGKIEYDYKRYDEVK
jgi:hypothetical protein